MFVPSRLRCAFAVASVLGLIAVAASPSEAQRADTRTAFVTVICQGMPSLHGDPTVHITITQSFISTATFNCDPNDPATRETRYALTGFLDPDVVPITVELVVDGNTVASTFSHGGGTVHYFDRDTNVGVTAVVALAGPDE